MHCTGEDALAQARHQGQGALTVEQADVGPVGQVLCVGGLEQFALLGTGDIQTAAWLEQRMLAEAFRRMLVERTAGAGQGLDLRRSVGLHEHGGRTAGGVIARLHFPFEQQYPALTGQAVAREAPAMPAPMIKVS